MSHHTEWSVKRARIATLLEQHNLNGVLLTRCANISWMSCGGQAHVGLNSESAVANILCTRSGDYLVANKIEMPRMQAEVVAGLPLEPLEFNWFEPTARDTLIDQICGAGQWGSDIAGAPHNLANHLTALRVELTDAEQQRFREHGLATGNALENATRMVRPGMTEMEIAGLLSAHMYAAGVTPVVALIAADDRIQRYRHPAPTHQRVERMAMLVVCARKHGLIVSATRLIAFGTLSDDLIRRAEACAAVDAHAWHATQPVDRSALPSGIFVRPTPTTATPMSGTYTIKEASPPTKTVKSKHASIAIIQLPSVKPLPGIQASPEPNPKIQCYSPPPAPNPSRVPVIGQ
jgi:antitoxin VapB